MLHDLVIFDCDGVLVDSELLAIRAMQDVLNDDGVPATEAMILACFGMKQADALLRIADLTGHAISPALAARLWPATRSVFEAALQPMPGVADFLRAQGNVKRCVASSSDHERIRTSLGLTRLLPFFGPDLFSSHDVRRGKPAPDLFLLAADRMHVAPRRCVVIEDSVFGVQGACAAGMVAIGFVGGSHIQPGHEAALRTAGARDVVADWNGVARCLAA